MEKNIPVTIYVCRFRGFHFKHDCLCGFSFRHHSSLRYKKLLSPDMKMEQTEFYITEKNCFRVHSHRTEKKMNKCFIRQNVHSYLCVLKSLYTRADRT